MKQNPDQKIKASNHSTKRISKYMQWIKISHTNTAEYIAEK